jgi:hypothetical protein
LERDGQNEMNFSSQSSNSKSRKVGQRSTLDDIESAADDNRYA